MERRWRDLLLFNLVELLLTLTYGGKMKTYTITLTSSEISQLERLLQFELDELHMDIENSYELATLLNSVLDKLSSALPYAQNTPNKGVDYVTNEVNKYFINAFESLTKDKK